MAEIQNMKAKELLYDVFVKFRDVLYDISPDSLLTRQMKELPVESCTAFFCNNLGKWFEENSSKNYQGKSLKNLFKSWRNNFTEIVEEGDLEEKKRMKTKWVLLHRKEWEWMASTIPELKEIIDPEKMADLKPDQVFKVVNSLLIFISVLNLL